MFRSLLLLDRFFFEFKIYFYSKKNNTRLTTASASNHLIRLYKEKVLRMEDMLSKGNKSVESGRKEKLENNLNQIERQLRFIEQRLSIVNTFKWMGSLKKRLLW